MSEFVDPSIFDVFIDSIDAKRFICTAPVGSGKSTALQKWIIKNITRQNFLVIVPTTNIAENFNNNIISLLNETDNLPDVKLCIKEGAFHEFEDSMSKMTKCIITTYSTACKCLGITIEKFYHHNRLDDINKYFMVVDEAHLLLEYPSLIETMSDFEKVGLITATSKDIKGLSTFRYYQHLNPEITTKYNRTIILHKLKTKQDEQINEIASDIDKLLSGEEFEKCLVKIEDKKLCKKLKDKLELRYKVFLYNGDKKEVELDKNGKFTLTNGGSNIDIVISTSCIQAGQSIKENKMLQVFVQTPTDTVTSVKQFIGRNRMPESTTHLYMHLKKIPENMFSYDRANNRYKSKFNQLKANAWFSTDENSWANELKLYGNVIFDDVITKNISLKSEKKEKEIIVIPEKEFKSKKELYKFYNIKALRFIPQGYIIKSRWQNKKGNRTRLYWLTREDTGNSDDVKIEDV